MSSILVIPDAHARPDNSLSRFIALGNFINAKRPDKIVCIGDWADMGSLSSYDKGTVHAEGRRHSLDVDAANEALLLTMQPMKKLRNYRPEIHITLGNHEDRITRACNNSPELGGTLSIDNIDFKKHGWQVHDFLKPLVLDGICFQHYFTSGIMGRPIGGVNHARSLVLKNYQSSVQGHSHTRDYYEDVRADGQRVFGLVVGCYDEGYHHYTTEQRRWWSGLVMLYEAHDGQAEPAFFNTEYVKRNYL